VLGILWTIFSALRLIPAVALLVFGHAHFPFLLAPFPGMFHAFFGPLLSMIGMAILGLAIAGLIAGLGLMAFKPWARVLTIVLGCINLIHIPFGTALGIYTLWVLFSHGADQEYQRLGPPPGLRQSPSSETKQSQVKRCWLFCDESASLRAWRARR
jgi:hypothetical protein